MEKIKNHKLKFIKYIKGDHINYQIKLICIEDSNINVEFLERYSSLKDFHENLKKEATSLNLPKFPPKKYFGNTDEKFLNQRMTALEYYFNTILISKDLSKLSSVKKWIESLIKKYDKSSNQEKVLSRDKSIEKMDSKETEIKRKRSNSIGTDLKNKQSFSQNGN